MSANVRKLAFDLSFRWLVPLQILAALTVDYAYLIDPHGGMLITSAVMLSVQGTSNAMRVALWRTLPVTDAEIGRARWWQMTGLPGAGIVVMMGAAVSLHALLTALGLVHGPMRANAMAIVGCLLIQFYYCVFLSLFWLSVILVRVTHSPWAYAGAVAVWVPWLLLLPGTVPALSADTRILILGAMGLIAGVILYLTSPRWPQPVTPSLPLDIGREKEGAAASGPAGQGGWLALCGLALLRPLLVALAILAAYVAMILVLKLGGAVVLQLQFVIPLIVTLQIIQFNATALRLLRALPGSALRLTACLFLPTLGLVAAATIGFDLILAPWLTGAAPQIDMVALPAFLIATALVLPAALSVRQAAMALILMLCMALVPLIIFGWPAVPPPWNDERLLAAIAVLAVCGSFFWMHAQISRGSRVYRLQPLMPARWRGAD